jgi:hypothetical protein
MTDREREDGRMKITIGQRLRSQVDATELVVVRPVPHELDLRCGGAELIDFGRQPAPEPALVPVPEAPPAKLGKRYTDPSGTLELLITKAGGGALTLDGQPLIERQAKPLPASD